MLIINDQLYEIANEDLGRFLQGPISSYDNLRNFDFGPDNRRNVYFAPFLYGASFGFEPELSFLSPR